MEELIKEYHRLYALTKKPEYLEIAANLGGVDSTDYEPIWQRKVNAGCIREGIPLLYPNVDKDYPLQNLG